MDHDDTDFQSQNFQLAGEDNSKFPSGLRPFALPKLDIDDQLQGHLRYDNLIDLEVFFSVQGHESSWVEVLSTGSSVVDFSSSAAESCSISKTNNVWSEATSTESVEMLLKSVGANEMTGNMEGDAHLQLSGLDSQMDASNLQPKSSNSPTDSTVVPTENDQSQRTQSRMMDDPDHSRDTNSRMSDNPSSTQPQLEHFPSFLMDEQNEQEAGSILSDRNSSFVLESVAERCIVSEKLSSSTSGSCPAAGDCFKAVHDGHSLDKLRVPSAEVDSRKMNNEPFPELAPLQNIYDSYHFEQDNQGSEVGITPQDSKISHISENKVGGGLHEFQNVSCAAQPLGAVNLSSQVSNETLLSESSDGLLDAVMNPVKMMHRNDDTCKRASGTLQPSFPAIQHAAEGLKSSVRMNNELTKEFVIGSNSALYNQPEADTRNSSPHLVTSVSTERSKMIQSPQRKLAHATGVPEETKNAWADNTNIFSGDESKLGALEHHQDSLDNLKSDAMEEKTTREEMSAVSGNNEQMMESGYDENAKCATGTSRDKFDSSDNAAPDKLSDDTLDNSEDQNIPLVKHEGSFKEGDMPASVEEPENTVLPASGPQEKMSAPLVNSRSDIVLTTVTGTSGNSEDKNDCSGVFPDDSSAALPDEKDLKTSTMDYERSFKEVAKPALEDEDHNVISPGSKPGGELSAVSGNSDIDAICSGTVSAAQKAEYKEQANSLGGLTTGETEDKSGNHPDAYSQKCQTDESLVQSEHHIDPATPSALGISTDKAVENTVETPLNAKDDLNAHVQDTVSSHCTDHSPGTVPSQGKLSSSLLEPGNGDGICSDATRDSSPVISCTEPSPQGGPDSNTMVHQTLDEHEDSKYHEASVDATQSSKQYSTIHVNPTPGSEETNSAGDDRSFSFEVGAQPNVSEKAHSPAWSPFPRYRASQSTEVTTEKPQAGSSLENTGDDSKGTSIVKSGKEQLSERKVNGSAGGPSDNSNISDNTKFSPPEQSQQHPTPELSVSSADVANLPFTDAQHLQLRAQIFVYGALIQGTPPGEAYMVAAFAEPGGGKPTWEVAWRTALERFQYQKSNFPGLETPTSPRIAESEKASKGTAVRTAAASKKGGKTVLPAHSAVALHSPTFNAPLGSSTFNLQRGTHLDFSQAVSPVFTYNSHMRQPSTGVASWYSQSPGPRSAPWLVPPQNLIFDSSMQPAVPTNETAKGSSSKNTSISHAVSPGVSLPSPVSSIVSPPLAVVHEEKKKAPVSTSKHGTTSQKPRKRKKASASPEQQAVIPSPQLKTDTALFTPAAKHTGGFTLSTHSPSNALGSRLFSNTGQITSVPNYQITGTMDTEQRIIFSEQICGAIEQSTGQAKGASMHSMAAVRHKESIWSHLSTISRNKLPPEVEGKLTSAAAAAEAAVSVAKAAAEAAKMASEAALQAKMMAEEALSSSKSVISLQSHEAGEVNVNSNPPSLSSSTPTSSWKIKDNSHAQGSIVSVAREVARKRVEEASAAAKQAENLDAILKAAELAAEAVFNAGTIIGMGEPLPFTLSDLLAAGPDGYWKSERVRNKKAGSVNDNPVTETLEVNVPADPKKSGRKRGRKPKDQALLNAEPSSSGKELQPDGMHTADGIKDVPTTTSLGSKSNDTEPINIIWNGIGKGSAVEVLSDKGGSGVAWFSAKVVDINEHSAFVSYYYHNEGTGPREEWVPLKQEGEKAPQIRLAHPATLSKLTTRKRRREMAGNCSWAIGDHVDAWVKDSWREGIIAQNYEANGTKFLVQFSGGAADSLVVDAWSLRPSLVRKDGQWIEWSQARERKSKYNKGDSPLEKRRRTGLQQAGGDLPIGGEAGGPSNDTITYNAKKPEEPLALSQTDMTFNIGKSVVENKTDALAFKRPGLQKEGSKVFYGVPKHGKKKKFMEVSKHYVAGHADKISEGNAPNRFAKHVVPQLSRPRDNTSKVDHRGRRVGETRSRIPKPSKSQNVAANSVPDKDPLPLSLPNSGVSERSFAFVGSAASASNTEKPTVEKNKAALVAGIRTEDPSVSEMQAASTFPSSKQNVPTTNRAKRKYVPTVDNLNRSTIKTSEKTTNSDSAEPRRSNRRIQPTSRLLEGLQSSLIISKVPGEKGPRSLYRGPSSRGRAHG